MVEEVLERALHFVRKMRHPIRLINAGKVKMQDAFLPLQFGAMTADEGISEILLEIPV